MIPAPGAFTSWQAWATAAIQVLTPFITNTNSVFFRQGQVLRLGSYAVANLPSATTPGRMILVTDETGGAIPAFSDGTNWRRVTDRAVVS
jgi:hypothetical protein